MKAKVKSFEVDVTPMTKYEFYEQVKKYQYNIDLING